MVYSYWLRKGAGPWKKVTAEEYAVAEADAGFRVGQPATFGFFAIGSDGKEVVGRVTPGEKRPQT